MPAQFPKVCRCCQSSHTPAGWESLPFKGVYRDEEKALEMRDCGCGSTLAVVLTTVLR